MPGRHSRTKGHSYERKWAKYLTIGTGSLYKRVLREVREGNCGDVEVVRQGRFPFRFRGQAKKYRANLNMRKVWEEARAAALDGEIPLGLCGIDRKEDLVVMSRGDFFRILDRVRRDP
jgi:hypothetical protein